MIDWAKCDVAERLPEKVSGAWVVKGTRITVDAIIANAADGHTPAELSAMFPGVTEAEVRRLIEFARQTADANTP